MLATLPPKEVLQQRLACCVITCYKSRFQSKQCGQCEIVYALQAVKEQRKIIRGTMNARRDYYCN